VSFDARTTPIRDGVASRRLEGLLPAEIYLEAKTRVCRVPAAAMRAGADPNAEQVDQLLFGEAFDIIEEEAGFFWGQAGRDGYVGFVAAEALGPLGDAPTHRVSAIGAYAFAGASIKTRAGGPYSINSLVRIDAREGRLLHAEGAGWIAAEHLSAIGVFETDMVAVAERFLGAPYLWGGRECLGVDCSGLVQQAMLACGRACPRDTDQQALLGRAIAPAEFDRGDLVFWKGHVAIGRGQGLILHANAHHMATAIEPLTQAIDRIADIGGGEPTAWRRL
jgi:cell wall-associated NlpC family hydrolase